MFGRDEKVSPIRLTAVQYIILGIFLIIAYGLWRLQVAQSDMYSSLAEKNRIRNVPILAPRGKILYREGRIIVDNYPSFTALLLRDSSRDLLAGMRRAEFANVQPVRSEAQVSEIQLDRFIPKAVSQRDVRAKVHSDHG